MKILVLALSMFLSAQSLAFDHSHGKWTEVLKKYLDSQAFVNYKELKSDIKKGQHPFTQYLQELSSVSENDYKKWSREQQMAFLINSYNAFTVKLIIDKYPVESIRDIGSFFSKPWSLQFFTFLGKEMSLDPIEHEMLRPVFKDYRIHGAVNCASVSCPVLAKKAFTPQNLDDLLDQQMRLWINDPSRNQVG